LRLKGLGDSRRFLEYLDKLLEYAVRGDLDPALRRLPGGLGGPSLGLGSSSSPALFYWWGAVIGVLGVWDE